MITLVNGNCYIIAQISDKRLHHFSHVGSVHVYNLEEDESERLAYSLVQALDDNPVRWNSVHIQQVVVAGGGTPELIKAIIKVGIREQSLDFLAKRLTPVVERFTEKLSAWVEMAVELVQQNEVNLKILYAVDRLTIAHLDSLQEILLRDCGTIGDNIYELRNVGLLEQLSDGVYRIPPLIRNKLNIYFSKGDLKAGVRKQLEQFALAKVAVGRDDFGSVYVNNKLTAKLSEGAALTEKDEAFLTAALLFKAGWSCYRTSEYDQALKLLRRAFERRQRIQDESSKIEVIRYFGLAAAREGSERDLDAAIHALQHEFHSNGFMQKAKSMALFLNGFSLRLALEYVQASQLFGQAYNEIVDASAYRQKSMILNEWVRALLLCPAPNYQHAVQRARESLQIQYTVQTLDVLTRALIAQAYHDVELNVEQRQNIIKEIERLIDQINEISQKGGFGFDQMRLVDMAAEEAYQQKNIGQAEELDLSRAIKLAEDAYNVNQRKDILPRIWQLRYQTEAGRDLNKLHKEVAAFLKNNPHANLRLRSHAARRFIETTFALEGVENARSTFRKYESLFPVTVKKEIRNLIGGSGGAVDLRDVSPY